MIVPDPPAAPSSFLLKTQEEEEEEEVPLSHLLWTGSGLCSCPRAMEGALDPTYILPVLLVALSSGPHDVQMAIEGGGLAYAVMATAAEEERVRRMGYAVLESALEVVEETRKKSSGLSRDWTSLGILLRSLRDAITQPLQKLPVIVTCFVAESIPIVLRPAHPLFQPVTSFLLQRPFLDLNEIPMLYQWGSLVEDGTGLVYPHAQACTALRT
ncbi:hypothetical protein GUITHDRAFT_106970 [Guillardia theta CCMP2712]|uniref:URB1 C-terminal domain-containing protein n=1 Tax=Guillardia theta (strain CCMP2712) TaxID=905079 RepID=L1JEX9_GUITC|nr:hypothetical protein GUITHDRAFT_106970 [Guillardia theta CCMP2712]EKX47056.1 hypothetical protein GUITHDRAFT_106970 [Guillardia theta CCMP2712]|eukprot:XP_005834036.1 hypothetical protein GUITHDRAFT_106970 [Guillardia theta CCMP2712]